MVEKQKELEKKFKKSKKISMCLCNLARLLAENGPIKKISRLNEIESRKILDESEIKEKIFTPRKSPKKSTANIPQEGFPSNGNSPRKYSSREQ